MKRIFVLVLTLLMVLAVFAGCRSGVGVVYEGFTHAGHVSIISGEVSIDPIGYMTWAKIDNGRGEHTETVLDRYNAIDLVSGKTDFPVMEIPKLVLDESVRYGIQVNGRVENVYLITQSGNEYTKTETTFEALSDLADGTYYVAVEVLISGNCDMDSPQHSYRYETVFCLVVGDASELKMYHYTWDGWGISGKTIAPCETTNDIINALQNMKETSETVPKVSNDVFKLGGGQYPLERGTMWIECENKIYRLAPDLSQICLVETHFGEGKVLEMPDEFKNDLVNAWNYVPYDYYTGTYNQGDKTVALTNVFKSGSSISMSIEDIDVENSDDPENTITVELVSSVDRDVTIMLRCQQSDDYIAKGDGKLVRLKKGVPKSVELTFGGWSDDNYWVYIEAGFTKAEIEINP